MAIGGCMMTGSKQMLFVFEFMRKNNEALFDDHVVI